MLPRQNRLRKKEDVDRVFRRGRPVSGGLVMIKHLGSDSATPRVAVLVGKKLEKKAVHRNRIKRRLREVIRLHVDQLPAGRDLLIVARSSKIRDIAWEKLIEDMLSLLSKISN